MLEAVDVSAAALLRRVQVLLRAQLGTRIDALATALDNFDHGLTLAALRQLRAVSGR